MWDLILNPFITVLTLLYTALGNSAVLAIVLFTVLIRVIMLPLTAQQMKSSKAMSALQPELQELQKKYKNDREKLAQEQMALYRKHGVNPVGGCLPLFIQLPIWIGLYQAINHALAATPLQLLDLGGRFLVGGLDRLVPLNNVVAGIDLTQPPQSWALILPVLVLITSWVQSKMMTPPPMPKSDDGEPSATNQAAAMTQSMTTIMPVMMGMFSLSFSVGLSIYFVVSNVISIIQYSRNPNTNWKNILSFGPPKPAVSTTSANPRTPLEEKIAARKEKSNKVEVIEGKATPKKATK
ncbi:MAG TPA: YidC/Oxa1 family membrane protein insertase [Aggregatilineales bacterium]|nr:YidC/Oxa1 family membrane protein insertase [Anaerolineae bacterium]HUN05574.1 YidC/Oxa1 family membrane protein insertase [Aggregatilineales bacterium]